MYASSSTRSAGSSLMMDWPIISPAEYPKTRSAALFQLITMPLRFLLTMASSEESTIASCNSSAGINVGWVLMIAEAARFESYLECALDVSRALDLTRRRRHQA